MRISLASLALSLCFLGGSDVSAAPRGASAKERTKRSRAKQRRGAKPFKRESRAGVPVLRSRKTPGRTKTRPAPVEPEPEVQTPPEAAIAAGIIPIDPKGTMALLKAMPPKKVVLGAGDFRHDNVWVEFDGSFGGRWKTLTSKKLEIHYPIAATMGRDVKLECWHDPTKQARLVEVVSRDDDGTETVWDSISLNPSKETKPDGTVVKHYAIDFELTIDTSAAQPGADEYRIDISTPSPVSYWGCSLELLED